MVCESSQIVHVTRIYLKSTRIAHLAIQRLVNIYVNKTIVNRVIVHNYVNNGRNFNVAWTRSTYFCEYWALVFVGSGGLET